MTSIQLRYYSLRRIIIIEREILLVVDVES